MPHEHHFRPAHHGDWLKYHEASRDELHRGELMDHWLRDREESARESARMEFEKLIGGKGSAGEIAEFEAWRKAESDAIASAETVAAVVAGEFVTIAAKEAANDRLPDFKDPKDHRYEDWELKRIHGDLITVADKELTRDLRPLDMKLDDPGLKLVRDDAKAWVTRSAGGLRAVADGFQAACAKAEVDFHGESAGRTAWDKSYVKGACEGLSILLDRWDKLLKTKATPDRTDLYHLAGSAHSVLQNLARECVTSAKAGEVAFVWITGIAIGHALGEKIAAQLASRVGVPTFQGMHDRIGEIGVRGKVEGKIAKAYKNGSDKLSATWKDQLDAFKKQLNKIDKRFTQNFELSLGDEKPMKDSLDNWNKNFKNPAAIGAGAALQRSVGSLAFELSRIRQIVEAPLAPKEGTRPDADQIREARALMLASIDGLVRQIQSDIEVGVRKNNSDLG